MNWGDIVAMITRIPVFQQEAVCLTKFGPELGETAKEILARKDLERRSGIRAHKNEFWWGIGEKGTAQSATNLISQYNATSVSFSAIKNEEPPKKARHLTYSYGGNSACSAATYSTTYRSTF